MNTEGLPRPDPARATGGSAAPSFRITDRLVQARLNRIVTPHATIQLEPKVMHVLVCLARRPGEVVTKEQLFEDVWEGAFVTEDVLTRAIGELRRAFADDAANPRVIETIRKSGYRLIAPVVPDPAPGPLASPTAPRARRVPAWFPTAALWAAGAVTLAAVLTLVAMSRGRGPSRAPMRIRPLTTYPGDERDPAVSPDGTRVAFVWNGGSGDDYSLYVKLVDTESQLRLTREPGVHDRVPVWSPDGQRLAFTRMGAGSCQILLISALGGNARPLAPCGDLDYVRLAWSPDGKWLARSRRDANAQLYLELLSPETLETRRLTRPPAEILGDSSPVFSPDGRTIAFSRNVTDGVGDIFRVPAAGGEPTRLTFDNRDTMGADWSADGKSIVFSSSRAGIFSLWRVAASGGEPVWVAGGGMKMKHPTTGRARNVIAYENWLYEVNLWRVPTGGAGAAAAVTATADEWNFEPKISPDGRRIAFVSTRTGDEEIWVCGSRGESPTRLTSLEGARLETPVWSPDGRRVLFSARRKGVAQLYAVAAEGGAVEQLTSEVTDAVAPAWSHDGRRLYFGSRRSGSWQIWALELSSRQLVPVTSEGGYAARESPDGRWLFFTKADGPGIFRQAIAGGPAERVFERLGPEDWANWQAGAAGLYFRELCAKHPGPGVALLPYGDSQPIDIAPLTEQGWPDFDVSGDGAWLIYPRVDRHACDIRLIENSF